MLSVLAFHVNVADEVAGTLTVSATATVFEEAPAACTVRMPLYVPAMSPAIFTLVVNVLLPLPDTGLTASHEASSLTVQLKAPPPVLLMLRVCAVGLPPSCWAIKDRLVGLVPIAGFTDSTGTEGGEFNCASPGIPAANFRIVRPPAPPLPEVDELPAPAAASGMVPVDAMPTALDLVVVADDGATLMVARGTATPTLLLNEDGSLD